MRKITRRTFIGKPCIHHGEAAERYVSNRECAACVKLRNIAYAERRRSHGSCERPHVIGTMAAVEASDTAMADAALGSSDPESRLLAIMAASAAEYRRRAYHEQMEGAGIRGRPRKPSKTGIPERLDAEGIF